MHLQALLRQVLTALSNPGDGRTELDHRPAPPRRHRHAAAAWSWSSPTSSTRARGRRPCARSPCATTCCASRSSTPSSSRSPTSACSCSLDTETGAELEVATGDRKLRERYAAAAAEQRAGIAAPIRGSGADHLLLRTDRDWLLDLVRFVGRRRDRVDALSRSAAHGSGPVDAIPGATMHAGAAR